MDCIPWCANATYQPQKENDDFKNSEKPPKVRNVDESYRIDCVPSRLTNHKEEEDNDDRNRRCFSGF
jgi:hypothetical protein